MPADGAKKRTEYNPLKILELPPLATPQSDWDRLEKELKAAFKRMIFEPMLAAAEIPKSTLQNSASSALVAALEASRVTHERGLFSGKFNSRVSRELRELGATFDRSANGWRLPISLMPPELRLAVVSSDARFLKRLEQIDKRLGQTIPENIAESVNFAEIFDRSLWKTERDLQKRLKAISVLPDLSATDRKKIAREWQTNMEKYVRDFTEKEIIRLRKTVQSNTFSGDRYESLVKTIQRSYGVSANKAKFLARQETNLLMAKFKETRYVAAGSVEYRWHCVAGSKLHPVRPAHKALEGKVFRWDTPPITTSPDQPERRNNPGEDYNCRCGARPIVRFHENAAG